VNERQLPVVLLWRRAVADSELPPMVKLVAHTLSLHMSSAGGDCYPGQRRLASEASIGKSTVVRAITALEAGGWLHVIHGGFRAQDEIGRRSQYFVRFAGMVHPDGPSAAAGSERWSTQADPQMVHPDGPEVATQGVRANQERPATHGVGGVSPGVPGLGSRRAASSNDEAKAARIRSWVDEHALVEEGQAP
jgi:DNA-binding transcriptional MocR family regulator